MRLVPLTLVLVLAACGSDPPDGTPLGQDIAAILARPEQVVTKVRVQHVLIAFVGAKHGSESKHTFEEARKLTDEVLARARAGDDFFTLVRQFSYEEGAGLEVLTPANRGEYAKNFAEIAFRLEVGEIGVAAYHQIRSPYGWHVIKRLE